MYIHTLTHIYTHKYSEFVKMLEADDKEELKDYIKKIKAELSQVSSEVCVCMCV